MPLNVFYVGVHLKAREEGLRSKRDIYVLGAANVGKSTFINYIIEDRLVCKQRGGLGAEVAQVPCVGPF